MVHQKRYNYVFFPHILFLTISQGRTCGCTRNAESILQRQGAGGAMEPWNAAVSTEKWVIPPVHHHGSTAVPWSQDVSGMGNLRLAGDVQHTLNHSLFPRKSPILIHFVFGRVMGLYRNLFWHDVGILHPVWGI